MTVASSAIEFTHCIEGLRTSIKLVAEVEVHQFPRIYIIKNIRTPERSTPLLPDLRIVKKKGQWIHIDSLRPSNLSVSIGKAIDAQTSATN